MSNLHEPMTSTTSSLQQPGTPSLHLQETIESSDKDSRNLNDLSDVDDQTNNGNTNFGNGNLVSQAGSIVGNVEDKVQTQVGSHFAVTTPGGYGYRTTPQTTDGTQTTMNLANDPNIRVMTVHSNEAGQSTVSGLSGASFTISNAGTTQVSQVQNVLSSAEVVNVEHSGQVSASVAVENNAEGTKYTYYPTVQNADASAAAAAGQFYVMMSPQDMIPNVPGNNQQRIIAPRGHTLASIGDGTTFTVDADTAIPVEFRKVESSGRSPRDERRRATHNEVERRRRDKINTWIMKLATINPDCQEDQTKQGQSKGGILSKTLDYIGKLRAANERLTDTLKDHDRLIVENQVLRQQMEELRRENALLRANIHMQQQEHTDVTADTQPMEASH